MKYLGLSIAVGIASTKTLAKASNNIAKKNHDLKYVLALSVLSVTDQEKFLSRMDVSDVWVVSRQWSKRLKSNEINIALDLKRIPPKRIRKYFNVVLERRVLELNDVPYQNLVSTTLIYPSDNTSYLIDRGKHA